jgi:hypothetical protein
MMDGIPEGIQVVNRLLIFIDYLAGAKMSCLTKVEIKTGQPYVIQRVGIRR